MNILVQLLDFVWGNLGANYAINEKIHSPQWSWTYKSPWSIHAVKQLCPCKDGESWDEVQSFSLASLDHGLMPYTVCCSQVETMLLWFIHMAVIEFKAQCLQINKRQIILQTNEIFYLTSKLSFCCCFTALILFSNISVYFIWIWWS